MKKQTTMQIGPGHYSLKDNQDIRGVAPEKVLCENLDHPWGAHERTRCCEHPQVTPYELEASRKRTFPSGATRDTDTDKLDYEGFESPLVMRRYAEYMHSCRKLPDGTLRDSDNWQKGIPLKEYMKSMTRHWVEVWGIHRELEEGDIEKALCALRFNVNGMLHEILKEKRK